MKTVIISESLYLELVEYFDNKADAYYEGDPGQQVANDEMKLLSKLDKEFEQYNGTSTIPY